MSSIMHLTTRLLAVLLLSLGKVAALDFEVTGYTCDESLYITASDFNIACNDKKRCTFGSSVATVAGTRK